LCKDYFLAEYKSLFLGGIMMVSMTAETALEEESAMVSEVERYKEPSACLMKCTICNRSGYESNNCFSNGKRDIRVNKFSVRTQEPKYEVIVEKRDISQHFVENPKKGQAKRKAKANEFENEKGLSPRWRTKVHTFTRNNYDGLEWEMNISKAEKLRFLVDTGADINLMKSAKLLREANNIIF
jgi:hypothetical protein